MFGRNDNGWIGVDVGDRAVKLAQVRRVGDRYELASAALFPRPRETRLATGLRAAKALAPGLRGTHAAATLSMRVCRVEPVEGDADDDPTQCVDSWSAGAESNYALKADLERVEGAVNEMSRVGLECEAIDGAPLAIARALQLSVGYEPDALLAAIDWGETTATFVAALGGQAKYCRRLGCEGYGELRRHAAEKLGLSEAEVDRLVARHGIAGGAGETPDVRLVHDAFAEGLHGLVQELTKTLEHLGGKLKTKGPDRLLLLGVGATASGLPGVLQDKLGAPTGVWEAEGLARSERLEDLPDCLLAQAIACSALAWEPVA